MTIHLIGERRTAASTEGRGARIDVHRLSRPAGPDWLALTLFASAFFGASCAVRGRPATGPSRLSRRS